MAAANAKVWGVVGRYNSTLSKLKVKMRLWWMIMMIVVQNH